MSTVVKLTNRIQVNLTNWFRASDIDEILSSIDNGILTRISRDSI